LRKITDNAAASSRAARRKKARTEHITQRVASDERHALLFANETTEPEPISKIKLFENIEEW
jgi:hypothetical protein